MKKIIGLLACLILAGIPSAFPQNPQAEDELILKARRFLTALEKNDFQAAAKDFDETMAKAFGPEKMAEFWKQVPNQLSPFKRQAAARPESYQQYIGRYEVNPNYVLDVTQEDYYLVIRPTGQSPTKFYAESQTLFYSTDPYIRIQFLSNRLNQVDRLVLWQQDFELQAKKIQ